MVRQKKLGQDDFLKSPIAEYLASYINLHHACYRKKKNKPQQRADWCLKICVFTSGQISPTIFFKDCPGLFNVIIFTKQTGLMKNRDVFFFSSYFLRPFGRENSHSTKFEELQPSTPAPSFIQYHSDWI